MSSATGAIIVMNAAGKRKKSAARMANVRTGRKVTVSDATAGRLVTATAVTAVSAALRDETAMVRYRETSFPEHTMIRQLTMLQTVHLLRQPRQLARFCLAPQSLWEALRVPFAAASLQAHDATPRREMTYPASCRARWPICWLRGHPRRGTASRFPAAVQKDFTTFYISP